MLDSKQIKCSLPLAGRNAGKGNESWIFALPVDRPFSYRGRERVVTTEEAQGILANTRMLQASREAYATGEPLSIPILIEHNPNGPKKGSVVDYKMSGDGESYGIWAKVSWNDSTWREIQASEYERVSVFVDQHTDMEGKHYPAVLKEISLTHKPVIESLPRIQDTLQIRLSQIDITDLGDSEMEEIQELITGLASRIEALEAAQAAPEVEPEEEEVQASEEPVEASEEPETTPDEEEEEEKEEVKASNPSKPSEEDTLQLSQVLEAVKALTDEVKSLKASKVASTPLHLSEVGHSGDAPGGTLDFEARVQALVKTGMSRIDAVKKVNFGQ